MYMYIYVYKFFLKKTYVEKSNKDALDCFHFD